MKGVLNQPTPKYVKDVQKFLGLANYYCQFMKNFAFISRLLCKTEKQKKAFGDLMKRFTKEPVLAVLDLDKKIRIKVNMSDYMTREMLSMKCKDEKWRPVIFLSKSLNEIKKNYKIYDKEMLTVIRGLENQKYLLESAITK